MYTVACGLLSSEAEAEDVVQEIWLRALRQDAGVVAELYYRSMIGRGRFLSRWKHLDPTVPDAQSHLEARK